MKPVFERLSADSLLTRCLHGGTQYANEAYHHIIWNRCPKEVFVGIKRLELAVGTATLIFNDGERLLVTMFEEAGLPVGRYHLEHAKSSNTKRVKRANISVSESAKTKRKSKSKTNVSDGYSAGAF